MATYRQRKNLRINSKEEAFRILDTTRYGIPFDAIKYLYHYGKDEEILQKIIFSLEHAYDESVF